MRALGVVVSAVGAGGLPAWGVTQEVPPSQGSPASSATSDPKASDAGAKPAPIVRRSQRAATDMRDGRVQVGTVRISMPGGVSSGGEPAPVSSGPASPVRTDGTIEVPANTLGPGLSLQQRTDLVRAQIRQAEARADFDRAVADRPLPDRRILFIRPGGWHGQRFDGYVDHRPLVGPVTTTVVTSDQLGAQAQRNFAEAARPRFGPAQEGRDEAVRRFGEAARPGVGRVQEGVDRAFLEAQREAPAGGR
jgi:hypothetical protein